MAASGLSPADKSCPVGQGSSCPRPSSRSLCSTPPLSPSLRLRQQHSCDKVIAAGPCPRFPGPPTTPQLWSARIAVDHWLPPTPCCRGPHDNGSLLKATKRHAVSQMSVLLLFLTLLTPAPNGPSPMTKCPHLAFIGSDRRSRLHSWLPAGCLLKAPQSSLSLSFVNLNSIHKGLVSGLRTDNKLGPADHRRNSEIPDIMLLPAWRTGFTTP